MKNLILILMLFASLFSLFANDKIKEELQNNRSQGREFLIAFPPNDRFNTAYKMLDIYVGSSVNTTATLKNEATGLLITKQVRANEITVFSLQGGEISQEMESHPSRAGQVEDKGYYITSPDLISVYVLSDKEVSADGYMAIPITAWGTKYIHCSFWDFKEFAEWGSGFIVLAAEDNTKVNIKLRGKGAGVARTAGSGPGSNKTIGSSISVTLRKGQTINIMGDGKTRGLFDMTGSEITADKNIGLISYHERCMIPVTMISNGRDHLSEMIPPVTAWGKEHFTQELSRGQDMGDFYRVVASENNTQVDLTWYNKKTKQLIGRNQTLLNEGEVLEALDIQGEWPGNRNTPGVRGLVKVVSDKPTLVMKYCYSANWDLGGGSVYDPFMIYVPPVEQYLNSSLFLTPQNNSGNEFRDNFLNVIALGDSTNSNINKQLLESVLLDNTNLFIVDSNFTTNRIPGTNYYSAVAKVGPGTHRISSNTQLVSTVYGYATFESYGWVAASNVKILTDAIYYETNAPVIESVNSSCDSNLIIITTKDLNFLSYSTELVNTTSATISESDTDDNGRKIITIFNKNTNNNAFIKIIDKFGNSTTLSLPIINQVIQFDRYRGLYKGNEISSITGGLRITNNSNNSIIVKNFKLLNPNSVLSIKDTVFNIPVNTYADFNFTFNYKSKDEYDLVKEDTLNFSIDGYCDTNLVFITAVNGSAFIKHTGQYSLDSIPIFTNSTNKILLYNSGNKEASIKNIDLKVGKEFSLNGNPNPSVIKPDVSNTIDFSVNFSSKQKQKVFYDTVIVEFFDHNPLSIPIQANTFGKIINATVSDIDFGIVRKNTSITRDIIIENKSTNFLRLLGLKRNNLSVFEPDFKSANIDNVNFKTVISPNSKLSLPIKAFSNVDSNYIDSLVFITDADGTKLTSYFKMQVASSIYEEQKNSITISTNNNELQITNPNSLQLSYTIFDASSKEIYSINSQDIHYTIDTSILSNGVYFLKISSSDELIKTHKFLK